MSRFLPGIADFSYCLNKWRYRSMNDSAILDELLAMDAKAFQLDFLFNHDGGAANRAEIHRRATASGITLTGADYGPPSKERFENQVAAARDLGMTVVRHACGPFLNLQEPLPTDEFEAALRLAAEVYDGTGLRYALENHQDYPSQTLADILRRIDSPNIGVFLDTGNSIALLEHPAETAALLAPFTFGIHLKDYAVLPAPGGYDLVGVTLGTGVIDNAPVLDTVARDAPQGTIPLLLENPLERCRVNLFAEPYRRLMGGRPLADLAAVAGLIDQSVDKFPDGITLPFEDSESPPEHAQQTERDHNRAAYAALLELIRPFP